MTEVFGISYASAYDAIYAEKDYAGECDCIEQIFRQYAPGPVHTVLDLGCGTGNHTLVLAERGYAVTGIDRSADMLTLARQKAAGINSDQDVVFAQQDITSIDLRRSFDAVLMMFAVLGYQTDNADVLSALQAARRHIVDGGLLIFDVWYGPAVLQQRPTDRAKVIPHAGGTILRFASGNLDLRRQLCTVSYRMWHLAEQQVVAETTEQHTVRYFFPRELEFFLEQAGFELLRLAAFPVLSQEPDETTWNVMAVARPQQSAGVI